MKTKEEILEKSFSIKLGGMMRSELEKVCELSEGKECIEIGSLVGQSTCAIAPMSKILFCIDCWDFDKEYKMIGDGDNLYHYANLHKEIEDKNNSSVFDVFLKNTKEYREKINTIIGDSKVVHKYLSDGSFDFILVDGDHSYDGIISDYINFLPKLRVGGLMCFHDFGNRTWPGIVKAVNEILKNGRLKKIGQEGTLVVCEKVAQ